MKKLATITVQIPADVLAFLQDYARRAAEELQRTGSHRSGNDVSAESVASIILEQGVRQLMGATGDTREREEQQ